MIGEWTDVRKAYQLSMLRKQAAGLQPPATNHCQINSTAELKNANDEARLHASTRRGCLVLCKAGSLTSNVKLDVACNPEDKDLLARSCPAKTRNIMEADVICH